MNFLLHLNKYHMSIFLTLSFVGGEEIHDDRLVLPLSFPHLTFNNLIFSITFFETDLT